MKILARKQFYRDNGRFTRIRKRPVHMLSYYGLNIIAMIKPFTVNHTTLWGDAMRLYLPDSGAIYLNGFHEADLVNLFVSLLEDGDTFLDVGAHVGYYSVLASSLVGDRGKVVSIEPTPRTYGLLVENTNSKKNTTTFNVAALNEEKEIEFYDYGARYSALNSTDKETSRVIPFRIVGEPIRMKTTTVDDLCKKNGFTPTVIKIDAEGAERLILQGMSTVLEKMRPLITVEVAGIRFSEQWGRDSRESIQFLLDKGYECFEIATDGTIATWTQRDDTVDNLLFVHSTKRKRVEHLLAP